MHFDKNGISGKFMSRIRLSLNPPEGNLEQNDSRVFIPELKELSLNEKELSQYIIDYIFDTTGFNIESINNIDKLPSINGLPFLLPINEHSKEIKFKLASGIISGSIIIRTEYDIQSLGNIVEVNGDLGFVGSSIKNLGKLKIVTGSFWIAQVKPYTYLKDLNELEFVGGDLYLKNSTIEDLNNLKEIGGTLNLRKTKIKSLGKLQIVGKNLYLPKEVKSEIDLSNIFVGGQVKYFNT